MVESPIKCHFFYSHLTTLIVHNLDSCVSIISFAKNNNLRRTNDVAEEEIASLQFDITQLEEKCSTMCDEIDEKNDIIAAVTAELDELKAQRLKLDDQMEKAKHKIANLSKYKLHVEESKEELKNIQYELNESKADVLKMKEMYDSLQSLAANWQSRMKTLHFTEILNWTTR